MMKAGAQAILAPGMSSLLDIVPPIPLPNHASVVNGVAAAPGARGIEGTLVEILEARSATISRCVAGL